MVKQTLYFGNPSRLSVENRQLKIQLSSSLPDGSDTIYRSIEDIGVIVIDSPQISITSSVISELIKAGAVIISCDSKHLPAGLMFNMAANSMQTEHYRYQIESTLPLRKRLWQQTVSAKIRNQGCLLNRLTNQQHRCMSVWAKKVKSGDRDNMEARAAAYYWKNLFNDNKGFRRHRYGDEPNSLLNYGYSILRAILCRGLVSSGLHPSIGIFHRNKYNPFCLADDVMEPYRPIVDKLVLEIIADTLNPSLENKEVKRRLLSIGTCDVKISGNTRPLMVAASETTASLVKCFRRESRIIRYPDFTHEE